MIDSQPTHEHVGCLHACAHTNTHTYIQIRGSPESKPHIRPFHPRCLTRCLLVRPLAITVLTVVMSAVVGATVTPVFTPLAALPALILILSLLPLMDDLHLQAADVERYCTEPEEGDAAHRGALEQQRWHRQQHHPPQGKKAANVRGTAKRHTHTSQDKEG